MSNLDVSTEEFLRGVLRQIANRAAMGCAYEWSNDFTKEQIEEVWYNKKGERYLTIEELQRVDKTVLYELGFGNWNGNFVLIPLWMFHYLSPNEVLYGIGGKTAIIGQDRIDLDVRFGYIAWGFKW